MNLTPHQVMTILVWFLVTILLAIMLLIARFYHNVSKERTYFWAFGVPIIFFGAASARYAFSNQVSGDALGDILWSVGGILLAALCIYLYNLMTTGR